MHNLGPSQLEQPNYEFTPFAAHEVYPAQPGYAQGQGPRGMAASPLEIAFAQEAPLMEYGGQEVGYHEAPYHEAPYHEAPYHEAPYHEAPYHEAPYHETAYHESPIGHEYTGHEFTGHEMIGHEAPVYETAYEDEMYGEDEFASGETMNEEEEMALTAEFLEIQSEDELDRFLGKLVRRAARGIRNFARSSVGRAIGGVLRSVARTALPMAGAALGAFVGGPVGAKLGSRLASFAGDKLGLELAGLTHEEANFATGRQFVRFAMNAARRAAMSAPNQNPNVIARAAVQQAAQRFAPGLLGPNQGRIQVTPTPVRNRGVWVRRGTAIIIYGA